MDASQIAQSCLAVNILTPNECIYDLVRKYAESIGGRTSLRRHCRNIAKPQPSHMRPIDETQRGQAYMLAYAELKLTMGDMAHILT